MSVVTAIMPTAIDLCCLRTNYYHFIYYYLTLLFRRLISAYYLFIYLRYDALIIPVRHRYEVIQV